MSQNFSINDLVAFFGQIVGRVEYVTGDGWAGVRGSAGRLDEFPAALLERAR